MRKRDRIKSLTPFIFVIMWLGIFSNLGISVSDGNAVPVVGSLTVLILASILITDRMFELFDKNDNEEDD